MSAFDEEWAELKRAAEASQPNRMQLAGTEKGGQWDVVDDLKVDPSVLRTRATKTDEVRGNFAKADDSVMTETAKIAGGLTGFRSASAFSVFTTRWQEQMSHLDRIFEQGIARPLREAANMFQAEDEHQSKTFAKSDSDRE